MGLESRAKPLLDFAAGANSPGKEKPTRTASEPAQTRLALTFVARPTFSSIQIPR
jgi:hypothetical protein